MFLHSGIWKPMITMVRFCLMLMLIVSFSSVAKESKKPPKKADKETLVECHKKYQAEIREQTMALSLALRQKVVERTNLIEAELADDQAYKDEVKLLKKDKKENKTDNKEEYRIARDNAKGRASQKQEIKDLDKEIKDLKKDINAIIKDITKGDKDCKDCLLAK